MTCLNNLFENGFGEIDGVTNCRCVIKQLLLLLQQTCAAHAARERYCCDGNKCEGDLENYKTEKYIWFYYCQIEDKQGFKYCSYRCFYFIEHSVDCHGYTRGNIFWNGLYCSSFLLQSTTSLYFGRTEKNPTHNKPPSQKTNELTCYCLENFSLMSHRLSILMMPDTPTAYNYHVPY